ncbi:MAG: hypothetical protein ABI164_05950, partial [Acidobacteriaceae bacterium]
SVGVRAEIPLQGSGHPARTLALFAEQASQVIVTCAREAVDRITKIAGGRLLDALPVGTTIAERVELSLEGQPAISTTIAELRQPWRDGLTNALEFTFHPEQSTGVQA